jgi:hypothetical protein
LVERLDQLRGCPAEELRREIDRTTEGREQVGQMGHDVDDSAEERCALGSRENRFRSDGVPSPLIKQFGHRLGSTAFYLRGRPRVSGHALHISGPYVFHDPGHVSDDVVHIPEGRRRHRSVTLLVLHEVRNP